MIKDDTVKTKTPLSELAGLTLGAKTIVGAGALIAGSTIAYAATKCCTKSAEDSRAEGETTPGDPCEDALTRNSTLEDEIPTLPSRISSWWEKPQNWIYAGLLLVWKIFVVCVSCALCLKRQNPVGQRPAAYAF